VTTVNFAFEKEAVLVPIESILPVRSIADGVRKSQRFRRIEASIREVGVIEPLVVFPQPRKGGKSPQYVLLDGHLRLDVLRALGKPNVLCLVATDDEGFTYNHKVNQISPIQEHFMLLKALESGVSEERVSSVLGIDVAAIRKKRNLLEGICPEAVELLKDRRATPGALRELRRVTPMRQIEMAELMTASSNFTVAYAKCLIAATPQDQLLQPDATKESTGLKPEDLSRIEREMKTLEADFRRIEDSHGQNMLKLVLAVGYLRRVLDSAAVVKYLSRKHADLLAELARIVESTDLVGPATEDGEVEAPVAADSKG